MRLEDDDLTWDGLDGAIVGRVGRCAGPDDVLCYDYDKMVEIFVTRDGMTHEEAAEWVDFNIVGAYIGERTPFVLFREVGE